MFTTFGLYAFAFWIGGLLRIEGIYEGGSESENKSYYTGGKVLAIMYSVVFGALNLGAVVPIYNTIIAGRIAGKKVYDIIDHIPRINPNTEGIKI